jgi:hypothetical protein
MAMVTVRRRAVLGGTMVARNASRRKRPGVKNAAEIDAAVDLEATAAQSSQVIRRR